MSSVTSFYLRHEFTRIYFLTNLRKHMLAVSEIMGALADKMDIAEEEKEKWTLVGLLHDLDYERTKDNPANTGLSQRKC